MGTREIEKGSTVTRRPRSADGISVNDVVWRLIAALIGGYAISYGATFGLALLLPVPKSEAVIIASMPSFLIYACVIVWSFTAGSIRTVWAGVGGIAACDAALWLVARPV